MKNLSAYKLQSPYIFIVIIVTIIIKIKELKIFNLLCKMSALTPQIDETRLLELLNEKFTNSRCAKKT